MNIIQTNKGTVELFEPSNEIIRRLNELTPYGITRLNQVIDGANYGIVMKKGEQEVFCLKQQPLEIERKDAELQFQLHHFMIVEAYCQYLKSGFSGAYLSAPYLRQRNNGLWESGVSHFIFPSKTNKTPLEKPSRTAYDNDFGNGATEMLFSFVECFKKSFSKSKITMPSYFGLDVRTRSHLQGLALNFMVLDSQIICLRPNLREKEDVAWTIFASQGIQKICYLPSVPLTISNTESNNKQQNSLMDSDYEPTIINHYN
jgi:hypothetical protein